MQFAHLAQRLFNTPLAIRPEKAEVIMAALAERLGIGHMSRLNGEPLMMDMDDSDTFSRRGETRRDPGYDMVAKTGIAQISIKGTLVHKLGTLRPYSGMTGYDGLRESIFRASMDTGVKAILLNIDSPGGEVAGCFDLVDFIYDLRGSKPIWAVLDEMAASAAYAIASAADRVIVPRTGMVGSIGVLTMMVEWSKALTANGINVTLVTYGDRKADGHPEIPLSKEALHAAQQDIDTMGELFVKTVARNRNISADKVRDTQAACFMGPAGVAVGLADAVMAPDAAFLALLEELAETNL